MSVLIIESKGKQYRCQYSKRDKELIRAYAWRIHSAGYAVAYINGRSVLMHRLILGVTAPEIEIDHRDHQRLNNMRSNLRICSRSQNRRNSRKLKPTAHSKFKGIYKDGNRWHVQINYDKRVRNLGRFSIGNEITAAKVYDRHALEAFKDYACINFPSSREAQQLAFPWI